MQIILVFAQGLHIVSACIQSVDKMLRLATCGLHAVLQEDHWYKYSLITKYILYNYHVAKVVDITHNNLLQAHVVIMLM